MSTPDTVSFTLSKISTKEFVTKDLEKSEVGHIELDVSIKLGINYKHRIIGCFSTITFMDDKELFMKLVTICEFIIEEESWNALIEENGNLTLPLNIARHFATLSIGTTRGILHSKTEGTPYGKYILPTIDVTQIIKGKQVFKNTDNQEKATQ